MRNKWHNLIRFTLAFTIALQSLMPTVAIADITMRCVNGHTNTSPCSREIVPAAVRTSAATIDHLSASCPMHSRSCHHMANCPMMDRAAATTTASVTSAAPACAITSTILAAGPDNFVAATKSWMLTTSPAQAPPSVASGIFTISAAVTSERLSAPPPRLPKDPDPCSHGLRAPPTR